MTATFDDYLRELHYRLGMDHNYPATAKWAFRSDHMPMPQVQHVINYGQYETHDRHWPLESWHGSHT